MENIKLLVELAKQGDYLGICLTSQLGKLAGVFRDFFHYTVQEVKLTIAGESQIEELLRGQEVEESGLLIAYYIGGVERRRYSSRRNDLIAVPKAHNR